MMMNRKIKNVLFSTVLATICLTLSGCFSSTRQNLTFRVNKEFKNDTLQVDIAGISENKINKLKRITAADYWSFDSKTRDSLDKVTLDITRGTNPFHLPMGNDIWRKWQNENREYIFIAADLPPSDEEHRVWKIILPMERFSCYNFWSSKTKRILITEQGFNLKDFS